jgi:hypothetical protein
MGLGMCWTGIENHTHAGVQTQIIQPAISHYTDYAILATAAITSEARKFNFHTALHYWDNTISIKTKLYFDSGVG